MAVVMRVVEKIDYINVQSWTRDGYANTDKQDILQIMAARSM